MIFWIFIPGLCIVDYVKNLMKCDLVKIWNSSTFNLPLNGKIDSKLWCGAFFSQKSQTPYGNWNNAIQVATLKKLGLNEKKEEIMTPEHSTLEKVIFWKEKTVNSENMSTFKRMISNITSIDTANKIGD